MDWFVISPKNGLWSTPDDTEGLSKALTFVEEELRYYPDLTPKDFYIFRGERHKYLPPSGEPRLVRMNAS